MAMWQFDFGDTPLMPKDWMLSVFKFWKDQAEPHSSGRVPDKLALFITIAVKEGRQPFAAHVDGRLPISETCHNMR